MKHWLGAPDDENSVQDTATPDVNYVRDRLGRPLTVTTEDVQQRDLTYDQDTLQLETETLSGSLYSKIITCEFETLPGQKRGSGLLGEPHPFPRRSAASSDAARRKNSPPADRRQPIRRRRKSILLRVRAGEVSKSNKCSQVEATQRRVASPQPDQRRSA